MATNKHVLLQRTGCYEMPVHLLPTNWSQALRDLRGSGHWGPAHALGTSLVRRDAPGRNLAKVSHEVDVTNETGCTAFQLESEVSLGREVKGYLQADVKRQKIIFPPRMSAAIW